MDGWLQAQRGIGEDGHNDIERWGMMSGLWRAYLLGFLRLRRGG